MSDTKGKEVPMTGTCCVKQHKRMAAGEKLNGQTMPSAPSAQKESKTPA
jgi:hypothetical protein